MRRPVLPTGWSCLGLVQHLTQDAAWPDGVFGDWRLHDLRQMMLHVLTETACHAGHLDAARELLDGQTWLILW